MKNPLFLCNKKNPLKILKKNVRLLRISENGTILEDESFLEKTMVSPEDLRIILNPKPDEFVKNPKFIFEENLNFCNEPKINNHFIQTFERTKTLFRKLEMPVNSKMKEAYNMKISELEEKGYISKVGPVDSLLPKLGDSKNCYFLPTNCIYKQNSEISRIRLTMDSSYLTDRLVSKGVNYLPKFFDLTTLFRSKQFAITTDVKEMFF